MSIAWHYDDAEVVWCQCNRRLGLVISKYTNFTSSSSAIKLNWIGDVAELFGLINTSHGLQSAQSLTALTKYVALK